MKKKALIAMLLACSFAFGTATMTACDLIGGGTGESGQEQGEPQDVAVTGVELNKPALSLKKGATEKLNATVSPSNATNKSVSWQSGNTAVATVDQSGNVTAVAVGSTSITVKTADGNKTAVCTVTVTEEQQQPVVVKVESVKLDKTSATIKVNQTVTLTETVLPAGANNKNVSWSTDKPAVATVENGVVTAKSVGTAKITVTTEDGNKSAVCTVTVEATTPATVKVTGVELDKTSATLKINDTVKLTETVKPADASNKGVTWQSGNTAVATVDQSGLVTAVSAGSATITVKTADGNFTATCAVTVQQPATEPVVDAKISYTYAGNECAAFEWADTNPANATVEYKLKSANSYTALSGNDKQYLVRQINATTARVDFVGLKGGAVYDFRITTSSKEVLTASDVTIHSYDRSGYAHFGKSDGVGAYKDDGTPKNNAVIVYVNEANKNTVKATVNGKERTGIVSILQNAGTDTPLIVRVVGTVGAATWNHIEESTPNGSGGYVPILPDAVKGSRSDTNLVEYFNVNRTQRNEEGEIEKDSNGKIIGQGTDLNISQDELVNKFNTLDESKYTKLNGLNSKIKYDSSKDEFDSAWNDCSIQNVKNVTVEGIGEDARIFQWGMTFKNSSSIEVRNLTFEDYTEDACSFEGGDTSAKTLDGFNHGNIWVHHNIFEEGMNYWDVCNEQDKHDGDGSTDFKGLKNITLSYNVYNGTHKTGLIGGSDSQSTANVTFHHNAYNACKSRMPLGRQANMHMYNNYYNGSTGQNMSLRGNAYAFIENCYFNNANDPINVQSGAAAKVFGCVFKTKQPTSNSNLKIVADRSTEVTNSNKFAPAFDTNSSTFYYKDGKSNVTVMFTAEETKTYVPQLAGVQKHGGDVTLGGAGGGSGSGTGTEKPDPNPGGETGALIQGDPSSLTTGELAAGSTQTFGGLKLYGSGKLTVAEGNNTITYNGTSYKPTKYISLGGGANFDGNEACIEFTVTGNCKLTVATRSSGTARTLKVVGGAEDLTIAAPDKSAAIAVTTVNLSAGTYKIGSSSGGINIYYIIIENLA